MLLIAGIVVVKRIFPGWKPSLQGGLRFYAANRAVSVAAVAAQAAAASIGAPPLLVAAVQQCATLAVARKISVRRDTKENEYPDGVGSGKSKAEAQIAQQGLLAVAGLGCYSSEPGLNPLGLATEVAIRGGTSLLPRFMDCLTQVAVSAAGLACMRWLVCERVRVPYTGRIALLPRRPVEVFFNHTVGLLSTLVYPITALYMDMVVSLGFRLFWLPEHLSISGDQTQQVRAIHAQLHQVASKVAFASGRPLEPTLGSSAWVLPVGSFNAVSIPGGHVHVHAGLVRCVEEDPRALTFVIGHEVGHDLARHGLEGMTSFVMQSLAISTAVGAVALAGIMWKEAQVFQARGRDRARHRIRPWLLRFFPHNPRDERRAVKQTAGLVADVNIATQLGLHAVAHFAGLAASRRREHEADFLALCLARDAGYQISSTVSGARLLFLARLPFLDMLGSLFHIPMLSTHPSHSQRLKAVRRAARGLPRRP